MHHRLSAEIRRLYRLPDDDHVSAAEVIRLVDGGGFVRAMLISLSSPADWAAMSAVWHGVQVDLALPAPAIAVNGVDGYELWFSLAEPVPLAEAHTFLQGLRQRYLPGVATARLKMCPALDGAEPGLFNVIEGIPRQQAASGNWSAFVAPDLAAVFAEDPWIDFQPGDDAQAELLSRLASSSVAAFQEALLRLRPRALAVTARPMSHESSAHAIARTHKAYAVDASPYQDPKHFLLEVMNDTSVELALRVDAAKALLACSEPQRH